MKLSSNFLGTAAPFALPSFAPPFFSSNFSMAFYFFSSSLATLFFLSLAGSIFSTGFSAAAFLVSFFAGAFFSSSLFLSFFFFSSLGASLNPRVTKCLSKMVLNLPSFYFRFQSLESLANFFLSLAVMCKEATLCSSLNMKLSSPMIIDSTFHTGFHYSGCQSLIVKHILCPHSNLPLGVSIITDGGFIGYSFGNLSIP